MIHFILKVVYAMMIVNSAHTQEMAMAYWHQYFLKNFFAFHHIQCHSDSPWLGKNTWRVSYLPKKKTLYASHSAMKPQPLLQQVAHVSHENDTLSVKWSAGPLQNYILIVPCASKLNGTNKTIE